jgi:hypothetical protein
VSNVRHEYIREKEKMKTFYIGERNVFGQICVIIDGDKLGMSFQNPKDKFCRKTARELAINSLLNNLVKCDYKKHFDSIEDDLKCSDSTGLMDSLRKQIKRHGKYCRASIVMLLMSMIMDGISNSNNDRELMINGSLPYRYHSDVFMGILQLEFALLTKKKFDLIEMILF